MNRLLTIVFFFCFLVNVLQAYSLENGYVDWYEQQHEVLQTKVRDYILDYGIYGLEQGNIRLSLSSNPQGIRKMDNNNYITVSSAIISQRHKTIFASFFFMQQMQPYQVETKLLYTADENIKLPSVTLFFDVLKKIRSAKKLPSGFNIHIQTMEDDIQNYLQKWIFYNADEEKEIMIQFTVDAEGGTCFSF